MNDAGQFLELPAIGQGQTLDLPWECYILGDRVYANRYPIITQFRRIQLAPDGPDRDAQIIYNEDKVEHTFSFMKTYIAVSEIYRPERDS